MLILHRPGHLLAAFGVGLIGSAVVDALRAGGEWRAQHRALPWSEPGETRRALRQTLRSLARDAARGEQQLSVLWSAGTCNLGSGAAQTRPEAAVFQALMDTLMEQAPSLPCTALHFVSSAGALFEGQGLVDAPGTPHPRCPYGHMKLAQERAVAALGDCLWTRIYRPTSVYGRVRPGRRLGLVSVLARDALQGRVTRLVGRTATLRDFVFADDVGRYIGAAIDAPPLVPGGAPGPALLAHGRPVSVFEVQRTVERASGRRSYVTFDVGADNVADITFNPALTPSDWRTTPLAVGVRLVIDDLRMRQLGHPGLTG